MPVFTVLSMPQRLTDVVPAFMVPKCEKECVLHATRPATFASHSMCLSIKSGTGELPMPLGIVLRGRIDKELNAGSQRPV